VLVEKDKIKELFPNSRQPDPKAAAQPAKTEPLRACDNSLFHYASRAEVSAKSKIPNTNVRRRYRPTSVETTAARSGKKTPTPVHD